MNKKILTIALLVLSGSAFAQYTGPSERKDAVEMAAIPAGTLMTVKQLNATAQNDQKVSLEGYVSVQTKKKDQFIFSDGTGEVIVEIKKKHMPKVPFNDKNKVLVYGEVDKSHNGNIKLEVESIQIMK